MLCINITIIFLRLPQVLLIKKSLNFNEQDKYSLGNIVNENNFGLMKINTSERELEVELRTGFINEKKVFKKLKVKF